MPWRPAHLMSTLLSLACPRYHLSRHPTSAVPSALNFIPVVCLRDDCGLPAFAAQGEEWKAVQPNWQYRREHAANKLLTVLCRWIPLAV